MKFKLIASFTLLLVLSITLLPLTHTVYGQTAAANTMKLSTKGTVAESSNFHGAILWTVINGNSGIIIVQSPAGRGLAHISISPSTNCSSTSPTCLLSTVTDAGQISVLKMGDTARFSIDVNSKQETMSILTGTLAGFDVSVTLSKIWSKNMMPTSPANPTNTTSTTPVTPTPTPTPTPTVNSTSTNSTTTQTSAKHLSINLSESVNMAAK